MISLSTQEHNMSFNLFTSTFVSFRIWWGGSSRTERYEKGKIVGLEYEERKRKNYGFQPLLGDNYLFVCLFDRNGII